MKTIDQKAVQRGDSVHIRGDAWLTVAEDRWRKVNDLELVI